jgi:hypothetical protein
MRSLALLCLVAATARADGVPPAAARPEPASAEVRERAARMVGATLVGGRAMATLEELSDGIGGRMTASPGYTKAVEWAQAQLRAAGIAEVKLEPFTMAAGWQRGVARGRVVAPFERALHLESEGWSAPTPRGGVRGVVVVLSDPSPEALAPLLPSLRGKIVLAGDSGQKGRSYKVYVGLLKSLALLHDAGVAALIMPARGAVNNVVSTGSIEWDGRLEAVPTATIGVEDAKLLERTAERGPVTVEIDLPNKVAGPTKAMSVVGELRGTERPNEWILVGAHLDSWDFATGSQDNGAGVAQVIEAARLLAATGPHKRSIRFALWAARSRGWSDRWPTPPRTRPSSAAASRCSTPTTAPATRAAGRCRAARTWRRRCSRWRRRCSAAWAPTPSTSRSTSTPTTPRSCSTACPRSTSWSTTATTATSTTSPPTPSTRSSSTTWRSAPRCWR